jgi:uncharacterized delta-60 repeat protein
MKSSIAESRSRLRWIGLAWCAALIVLLLASASAASAGKAGRLDRSFSGDGKSVTAFPTEESTRDYVQYRLPYEFSPGRIATARAGGGRTVVANGRAIVRYLANGRRDPGFGGGGAVPIGRIEGSRFQIANVAVDSQGRVLVAGTTRPKTSLGMEIEKVFVAGPIPSMATIRRYLPDGQLDPNFGTEGVFNTDLGAGPPTIEGQAYPSSAVGVVGLAVDAADRPIVTGSTVFEVGRCSPSQNRYEASRGIVARLTVAGALDPAFSTDGLESVAELSWLGSPTLTPAGVIVAGSKLDPCPRGNSAIEPSVLLRLRDDGSVDQGFGTNGFWARPFTRVSDIAAAPGGKLVLLTRTIELSRGEWIESNGDATRLRANGSLDRSFGQRGRAKPQLAKWAFLEATATDRKGRVLLLGNVWSKRKKTWLSRLLLLRLTAAGEFDPDFGRRGRAMTSFGGKTKVRGTDVFTGGGKIVAGGKIVGPSLKNGFALARYLGG